MQLDLLHPADQMLMIMERIYRNGMTTTSGGNLSIRDDSGDIWITPAGVDKGSLTASDMVCLKPDGTVVGRHKPSTELPFHRHIYRARPDLKAVVHAHPPALVAFSIVRKTPNLDLLPYDRLVCGEVGIAKYELPGSQALGENIAFVFATGVHSVILENHGVVVGGTDLFTAFRTFETLDFCARLEIQAKRIGEPVAVPTEGSVQEGIPRLEEFLPGPSSVEEKEARREICKFTRRAYDQKLFTGSQGTLSQRLEDGSFLITPYERDRAYIDLADIVRIQNGKKEQGKTPCRSVKLHRHIYEAQPHVHAVIMAHPPNIMAFAVTKTGFDSRLIPESYYLLRDMPKLPFGAVAEVPEKTAGMFTPDNPIVLVENECVIATGRNLLSAFDRMEVAEYSAISLINSGLLGPLVPIDEDQIEQIKQNMRI